MCGILFHISQAKEHNFDEQTLTRLSRRGPDALETIKVEVSVTPDITWYLTFISSVLWLRGHQTQKQPLVDTTGSILCWNGEAWRYDGEEVANNDTTFVFQKLLDTTRSAPDQMSDVLNRITGPYAFVFYDSVSKQLFYGRDILGRRSLLSDAGVCDDELTVSSIGIRALRQAEVDTRYFHKIDLTQPKIVSELLVRRDPIHKINHSLPTPASDIASKSSDQTVADLLATLRESVRLRVQAIPSYTITDPSVSSLEPQAKVAILFSGGLDCTLLARLTHDVLPSDEPIDLLNVAFENPRVARARQKELIQLFKNDTHKELSDAVEEPYDLCPDRITGLSSFAELCLACPTRLWRFVSVNITYTKYLSHRSSITALMAPHNTEMDVSITAALYFAARGSGLVTSSTQSVNSPQEYTTTARVLLSGLGADELFAGYARHASAFSRGSYTSLIDELDLDISRIGTRNLGRDDRVIAHWGRETRYPYLDETFVNYSLALPVWEKCGFRTDREVKKHFEENAKAENWEDLDPAKMLLRMALWQLGMKGAAQEKKRAIQFGTRSAKMDTGRTKGTDAVVVVETT